MNGRGRDVLPGGRRAGVRLGLEDRHIGGKPTAGILHELLRIHEREDERADDREHDRTGGVVLAIIAFVLIAITISMACAVFAPVWEEFRQMEKERKAAKAPAAELTAEVQA